VGYRGQLHQARSVFHELLGLLLAGVVSGLLFWLDPTLARVVFVAFAVHIAQDWIVGKSHPLAPADWTVTQFFALSFRGKVLVDVVIIAISGGLWVLYLAGAA
jgi:phage shock protein PspC (stress-responsive transcriptional regulator)